MSKYEKIKAMSIEQLAKILVFYDGGFGVYSGRGIGSFYDEERAIEAQIEWLKSEDVE